MNDIVEKVGKFNNLPFDKQCEFMEFHEELKHEYRVVEKENSVLREGLSKLEGGNSQ